LTSRGDLEWDGLVVVAGRDASMTFTGSGRTIIRGAAITSDPNGEGAELTIGSSIRSFSIRSSTQNVEMVQAMRALHSISNWREL